MLEEIKERIKYLYEEQDDEYFNYYSGETLFKLVEQLGDEIFKKYKHSITVLYNFLIIFYINDKHKIIFQCVDNFKVEYLELGGGCLEENLINSGTINLS